MEQAMTQQGTFSWNELMTTDVAAAKVFYGSLFGWVFKDIETCDMGYTMASVGEKEAAGIMSMPPEAKDAPPSWGAYVTVDDVDQKVKQVEILGGKIILPAQDIPDVGRFAVISDPQGAVLMIMTYTLKK